MLKIGIVGLGLIAYRIDEDKSRKIIWSHINAYLNTPETRITAVCDTNQSLVDSIKRDCEISKGYTDYRKMLSENKFDIVSICTPIHTHYSIIKECIQHGVKAIFCEKTISYSLEEVQEIRDLCHKNNIIFAVNYIFRWDSFIQEVKTIIDSGVIGNIYSIVGYGATALHTSTSHIIDLMQYFANSEVDYVVGDVQHDYVRHVHGHDDVGGSGFIKFKSGITAFIKGTSTSPLNYMFEIDILAENGRIRLFNNGNSYEVYKFVPGANEYLSLVLDYRKDNINPNQRMLEAVEDIIIGLNIGKSPLSNVDTAAESVKIIEGIKQSALNGEVVKF